MGAYKISSSSFQQFYGNSVTACISFNGFQYYGPQYILSKSDELNQKENIQKSKLIIEINKYASNFIVIRSSLKLGIFLTFLWVPGVNSKYSGHPTGPATCFKRGQHSVGNFEFLGIECRKLHAFSMPSTGFIQLYGDNFH